MKSKIPLCMEPIIRNDVVSGDEWLHQIKWDGIRGLTLIENNAISISTRNNTIITNSFSELNELTQQIKADKVILDGEIIVFDSNGKPSFSHVLKRMNTKKPNKLDIIKQKYPAKYIVFDILKYNDTDTMRLKLTKRQEILTDIFSSNNISTLNDSFSDGDALFAQMKENKMEGIVSKRKTSTYIFGKQHNDWYKTKISRKMLCIVMGINYKHNTPASLSIGIFKNNQVINVGNVYSGLTQKELTTLDKHYADNNTKDFFEIAPNLTCWVKFTEWKNSGRLRNPVILGFSNEAIHNANGKEIII